MEHKVHYKQHGQDYIIRVDKQYLEEFIKAHKEKLGIDIELEEDYNKWVI